MERSPALHGWTADDLPDLETGDGRRFEVIDGSLLVSPMERLMNLRAAGRLARQLDPQVGPLWLAEREVGVRIGTDGLVPDVTVVRALVDSPRTQLGYDVADVALVVEVVSPSSRKRDRFFKPAVYAEAGIGLFWRLELDPTVRLAPYVLEHGAYLALPELTGQGTVQAAEWLLEVDLDALL